MKVMAFVKLVIGTDVGVLISADLFEEISDTIADHDDETLRLHATSSISEDDEGYDAELDDLCASIEDALC